MGDTWPFPTGKLTMEQAAEACTRYVELSQSPSWPFWEGRALSTTKFVSCSPGRTEYTLTISEPLCNATGNLHGGCAATILDCLTSTVTMTIQSEGFLDTGSVSRTLTCTYLKALPKDEECTVICEAVRAGKRLVHVKGEIRGADGQPAVVCSHDKVPLSKM